MPSRDETALVVAVARQLLEHGVRFVAVDLVYPWIVEFNLANPGGLETIERLTGENLAPARRRARSHAVKVFRRRRESAFRS